MDSATTNRQNTEKTTEEHTDLHTQTPRNKKTMKDAGAKRVKRMLSNDKYKFVYLSGHEVDDSDCVQVSAAIRANTHITYLDMKDNKFGPKGLQLLFDAIATHPTLKYVYLSGNNINDAG